MTSELIEISTHRCFDGSVGFYSHHSDVCASTMRFGVYLPPLAASKTCPVLFYLAGLTCTEETFFAKSGAQRYAAEHGLILVSADTSPRGLNLPGEDESWDFGSGAGFYVDATASPWNINYHMYSYVTQELPALVCKHFPADRNRFGIFGHSMGGHGALVCGLRNPQMYLSVSALAPVCAPSQCPWGEKAFGGFLGNDRSTWQDYDATQLLSRGPLPYPILVDQGQNDKFLEDQLKPDLLREACRLNGQDIEYRQHPGYDHGYYFVSSVMAYHVAHHVRALCA